MAKRLRNFVRGLGELIELLLLLKQVACPFCGATETLNRHSLLYGNDPAAKDAREQSQRGQRVWCSDRGQRGGCGRSFSIFLAEVLPRHTIQSPMLWSLLDRLHKGGSVKAAVAALRLPFALESIYHLMRRIRHRLAAIRSRLCREQQPPPSSQSDPLHQTVEHLRSLFPGSACPCAEFQLHFQHPLLE